MRRFELADGTSKKFWEIGVDGKETTVRFGPIGAEGQTRIKAWSSPALAQSAADKLIAEKTKKGYKPTKASSKAPKKTSAKAAAKSTKFAAEVASIAKAAKEATTKRDKLTRVYLIEPLAAPPPKGSVNRAGGPPIGFDAKRRPSSDGKPMHHLITIDLDDTPELRHIKALKKARAIAVFIDDAADNFATEPGNTETKVIALTEADVGHGEWAGPPAGDPKARSFRLHAVDVPKRVFDEETDDEIFDAVEAAMPPNVKGDACFAAEQKIRATMPMAVLRDALMSAHRIGGGPIFWDGDEHDGDFILQFAEEVVDVNLGDAGTMYVFADTAFWAGH